MTDITLEKHFNHADYAGFWRRFCAGLIDLLLFTPFYYGIRFLSGDQHRWIAEGVYFILALLLYGWFFTSKIQASPGMYLMKFHVCDTEGRKLTFLRVMLWNIAVAIGWAVCCAGVMYLDYNFDINAVLDMMDSCTKEKIAVNECNREIETILNIPFQSFIQLAVASFIMAMFLSLIWALSIVLSPDKAGFHNLLCKTRFVKGRTG